MLEPRRLTTIRRKLSLSQEGMARLLGVSFASVNRWEGAKMLPKGCALEVYRAPWGDQYAERQQPARSATIPPLAFLDAAVSIDAIFV